MKSQMHPTKLILATLCAGSLLSGTAFAAKCCMSSQNERGMIQSLDTKTCQLTLREAHKNAPQTFVWNKDTKFIEHGSVLHKSKVIAAADLREGERVNVLYDKQGDQWVAREIIVTGESHAMNRSASVAHNKS